MRRRVLNIVLAGFIAGSAYDVATDQEHWPFSQYPMFAVAWANPTFTWLRVVAVTADGREFPLTANAYIAPFDQSRLPKAMRRILAAPDGDDRIRVALRDVLARYEKLRRAGSHDGPPAAAMRLYQVEYTIDRDAANVDRPDRRLLVAEVTRP
jgi:hypothetical protein